MIMALVLLASTPNVTIYVDQREQCGGGIYQTAQQRRSMKLAVKVKREQQAQGKTVSIVKVLPGMMIDPRIPIINPAC